jgi:2-keto-4-pentenoate hydratase/2-oxohepta-3-ene-1,7-dioic acid hydratase in catechol pathway
MKLVFYDDFKFGAIKGDTVVDLSGAVSGISHTSPQDLINQVIADFSNLRGSLQQAIDQGTGVPLSSVKLQSPLPSPRNLICMAVNYMEDGTRAEPAPINAFHKSPDSVIGDGDTMVLPDVPATIFEGEAEMALVIGKPASNVKPQDAFDYVFGYMNFIDGSARGLLPAGNTFYQMKSRATFAPMGPYLVTADEISDPHKLQIKLWVNERLTQNYNTDDLANKIPRIIEWVTSIHDLKPGDIVPTGTNHRGLSAFQDGDKIEIETEGLGTLHFNIRDDLKRTWPRDTRLDRQNQGFDGPVPQATGKYAP